jgi:hypothetical protein
MINNKEIDKLILLESKDHYLKVARIILQVVDGLKMETTDENCKIVEARILALVEDKKLEAVGDVKNWRFSEVRLKKDAA